MKIQELHQHTNKKKSPCTHYPKPHYSTKCWTYETGKRGRTHYHQMHACQKQCISVKSCFNCRNQNHNSALLSRNIQLLQTYQKQRNTIIRMISTNKESRNAGSSTNTNITDKTESVALIRRQKSTHITACTSITNHSLSKLHQFKPSFIVVV